MAGHSKFKNIMFRKGAQDKKRAKLYSKLGKEITVAAKLGMPDPDHNPRLRTAIVTAKSHSMPKDNIKRAIEKASGNDSENYEEVRYEGYGPGKVAIIIEALTDNRNRTVAEIRGAFNKGGGNLGDSNSVSYNFERIGQIKYNADVTDEDGMLEAALEAGADDVESSDLGHLIYCQPSEFGKIQSVLETSIGEPALAGLEWRALNTVKVQENDAKALFELLDVLDDLDDVQSISANYEIDDQIAEALGFDL
ncbi:MAG: YebC/PmpR family DNA-binding transcriptional regulator [Rhodospirillaceae bacterium]|nr:YebC/PmpR family DNA-binding transcriptional regulator [Rhodospirillaceae bacterium]